MLRYAVFINEDQIPLQTKSIIFPLIVQELWIKICMSIYAMEYYSTIKRTWNTNNTIMQMKQTHYVKWEKPVKTDHAMYDSIYIKCLT